MSFLANEAMREEENNMNNSQNSQDAIIVDEDIEERKIESNKAHEMLEKFIAELGEKANETVDFEKYAESFKFKTKLHHMSLEELRANWEKIQIKLLSCKSPRTNWNEEELNALIWVSLKYAELHSKDIDDLEDDDFEFISHFLPLKDGSAVKHKWQSMKSVPAGQIPWSREEEELLSQIYLTFKKQDKQNKWSDISKVLESKTKIFRRGKQCRERWNNYLDPDMNRGNWSDDEDYKLLSIALELGSTQWSSLAKRLSKRTENAVKNRFKSLMKKERKERIKNGIEVKSAEALTEHIDKTILAEILEKLKDKIVLQNLQAQQENNNNIPINNNNSQLQGNPSTNATSTAPVVPPIYQVYFAPTGYGPMIPSGQFLAPAVQPINFQILNQNNNSSTPYSSPDHSPVRQAFIQQRMGNTDEAMKQQQQFNNTQQFSFSQQQAQQQQQPIVTGTAASATTTTTAEQAIQQQLSQLNLNGMSPVNQSIFKQQILQQQLFQQQQQQAQLQQAQIQQLQQQQQQQIQQNGSIASLMQNLQSQAMINHTNLVSSPQFINSAVGQINQQPFISAINSNRSTGGMAGSFSEAMNIIYSGANTPSNAVSSAMISQQNGGIAAVQQANTGTASPFMPVFSNSSGKPGDYTPQPKSSPMLLQQPHLSSFSGNNTPQSNRNKRTDKTSQFADFEKLQKLRIGELEDHSASPMHITEKTASPSERKAMQLMVKTKIEEEGEDEELQQQQQQLQYPQDTQSSKPAVNGQLHDQNHINSPLRPQQEPYDSDSGNNEFKRRLPAGTSSFNKFRKDDAIMQQKQQQQMQIIQQQQQQQSQQSAATSTTQAQQQPPLLPLTQPFQLRPMKMELQQQSIINEQQQQQQCNSPQNAGSLGNLSSQPELPSLPLNQQSQYTAHQLSFQHLDYLAMVQQQQQQLAQQQQQQQQQFQQIFSPSNSNNQKQATSSQQSLGFGMFVSPLAMIQQKQTQLSQQQQQQQQQPQIIPNNPGISQAPPPLNLTACQSNDIMTQHSLLNFYNTRPMQPLLMQQQQQQQQQQPAEKTEQMENQNDLLMIQNMLPSLSLQQIDLLQQQLQQQQKAKLQQQQQMYQQQQQQQQMQQQQLPLQNTSNPSNFQQLLVQQQQQAVAAAAASAAAAQSIH